MDSIYEKLRHGHIRLLSASPGSSSKRLHFRFIYAVPHVALNYTAISYAWGNEPHSRQIDVDGHTLHVKPTLWAGLHAICRVRTLIWADAVCINQEDLLERNEQVRIMEQVYRNAAVVSVWLGNIPLPEHIRVEGGITILETDSPDWFEWMERLAKRPYWSRCWVIQEFLLAREIHLYCGNAAIDYLDFQNILSEKTGIELLSVQLEDIPKYSSKLKRWPALSLVMERHIDRYPELSQGLHELLINHPHARSTDPRDRVFALLGLLHPEERHFLLKSFPDYTLTEEQVHVVTLAHIIQYNLKELTDEIFKALYIVEHHKIQRLKRIVHQFDYIGAHNPAQEAEYIATFYLGDGQIGLYSSLLLPSTISAAANVGDEHYSAQEPSSVRARCESCIQWMCGVGIVAGIVFTLVSINKF